MTTAERLAALDLPLRLKFGVLPCHADKTPWTKHGLKDASADPERIASWAAQLPGCRWGARPPRDKFVLDIDVKAADGFATLRELEARHAPLPETLRNLTPSGGEHRLFHWEAAHTLKNKAGVLAGLDVRTNLGYHLVAPSPGYRWADPTVPVAEAPGWLIEALPKKGLGGGSSSGGSIPHGARNDHLFRMACRWRAADMPLEEARVLLRQWHDEHCAEPFEDPDRELDRILASAWKYPPGAVTVEDFFAYMPGHTYLFIPNREPWPAVSVNARCAGPLDETGQRATQRRGDGKEVPMKAAEWLDCNRPVDQMTWAPGEPLLIKDRLVSWGGWIDRPGSDTFNLYVPPEPPPGGDPQKAGPWLDHVRRVYPDDAEHIFRYLAHRVQRPAEKINHALCLFGAQGIGKDTALEPAKAAVGPWNWHEVSPKQLLSEFNGFVKSVVLRVSEARDLGDDINRYSFYDTLKAYTAAPPDVLRCNEKNLREHSVFNVCGVILTSNYRTEGIYLPADDRRHYVAWSELTKDDFTADYWQALWRWYGAGGIAHVAAWLAALDLSAFDPKAPPPKTPAFWDIVSANRAPEDAEMADVLDALGRPDAVTVSQVADAARLKYPELEGFLKWRRNARQIPHRFAAVGYEVVRNDGAPSDGLWVIGGRRQAVYAQKGLSVRDRIAAAQKLVAAPPRGQY